MLEFKLNYFFEKYKNASVISSPKFKEAFIKKEELLNELLVMIQRYQIKKYGDLVTTGKNTYETKGNGKRFNMELTRERNRFGTKEERKRRKINEKWRIQWKKFMI